MSESMQIPAADPQGKPWNEAALHALGAAIVRVDENGDRSVSPPIDLAGYAAAVNQASALSGPKVISRRQFAQALAKNGDITRDEALAYVRSNTLPAAFQKAVDGIKDADVKFDTEMLLTGAMTFERLHPLVGTLGAPLKKSDADLDALWVLGATL